jgi:hypothetical protein
MYTHIGVKHLKTWSLLQSIQRKRMRLRMHVSVLPVQYIHIEGFPQQEILGVAAHVAHGTDAGIREQLGVGQLS